MGLIIMTNESLQSQSPEKNPDCLACNAERPEGFSNEIEKIFHVLNGLTIKEMSIADDSMCEFHAKKARSLKIFSSKDELFELNQTGINQNPTAKLISEEEYWREEYDGEVSM